MASVFEVEGRTRELSSVTPNALISEALTQPTLAAAREIITAGEASTLPSQEQLDAWGIRLQAFLGMRKSTVLIPGGPANAIKPEGMDSTVALEAMKAQVTDMVAAAKRDGSTIGTPEKPVTLIAMIHGTLAPSPIIVQSDRFTESHEGAAELPHIVENCTIPDFHTGDSPATGLHSNVQRGPSAPITDGQHNYEHASCGVTGNTLDTREQAIGNLQKLIAWGQKQGVALRIVPIEADIPIDSTGVEPFYRIAVNEKGMADFGEFRSPGDNYREGQIACEFDASKLLDSGQFEAALRNIATDLPATGLISCVDSRSGLWTSGPGVEEVDIEAIAAASHGRIRTHQPGTSLDSPTLTHNEQLGIVSDGGLEATALLLHALRHPGAITRSQTTQNVLTVDTVISGARPMVVKMPSSWTLDTENVYAQRAMGALAGGITKLLSVIDMEGFRLSPQALAKKLSRGLPGGPDGWKPAQVLIPSADGSVRVLESDIPGLNFFIAPSLAGLNDLIKPGIPMLIPVLGKGGMTAYTEQYGASKYGSLGVGEPVVHRNNDYFVGPGGTPPGGYYELPDGTRVGEIVTRAVDGGDAARMGPWNKLPLSERTLGIVLPNMDSAQARLTVVNAAPQAPATEDHDSHRRHHPHVEMIAPVMMTAKFLQDSMTQVVRLADDGANGNPQNLINSAHWQGVLTFDYAATQGLIGPAGRGGRGAVTIETLLQSVVHATDALEAWRHKDSYDVWKDYSLYGHALSQLVKFGVLNRIDALQLDVHGVHVAREVTRYATALLPEGRPMVMVKVRMDIGENQSLTNYVALPYDKRNMTAIEQQLAIFNGERNTHIASAQPFVVTRTGTNLDVESLGGREIPEFTQLEAWAHLAEHVDNDRHEHATHSIHGLLESIEHLLDPRANVELND